MIVIVCGSRSFTDYDLFKKRLDHLLGKSKTLTIISGGAEGADRLAQEYAGHIIGCTLKIYRPNYVKYSKNPKVAPIKRNEQMVDESGATHLVAFWDGKSPGTKHIIAYATEKGLKVKVINVGSK